MLLLKRRRDQLIKIGPDVVVQVVRIEGGWVVLGITAPAAYRVSRADLSADAPVDGRTPAQPSPCTSEEGPPQ